VRGARVQVAIVLGRGHNARREGESLSGRGLFDVVVDEGPVFSCGHTADRVMRSGVATYYSRQRAPGVPARIARRDERMGGRRAFE
jgi:hypothetical protein